jgi:hypothetical protein
LVSYLVDDVLPHAIAEEAIYRAAGERNDDLADLVGQMITEHEDLACAAERHLGAAAEQAGKIAVLFTDHVAKESDFLLPGLLAGGAGLARLLDQMHCRTEAARQAPAAGNAPAGNAGGSVRA